jgi:hypothetical protein
MQSFPPLRNLTMVLGASKGTWEEGREQTRMVRE